MIIKQIIITKPTKKKYKKYRESNIEIFQKMEILKKEITPTTELKSSQTWIKKMEIIYEKLLLQKKKFVELSN